MVWVGCRLITELWNSSHYFLRCWGKSSVTYGGEQVRAGRSENHPKSHCEMAADMVWMGWCLITELFPLFLKMLGSKVDAPGQARQVKKRPLLFVQILRSFSHELLIGVVYTPFSILWYEYIGYYFPCYLLKPLNLTSPLRPAAHSESHTQYAIFLHNVVFTWRFYHSSSIHHKLLKMQ